MFTSNSVNLDLIRRDATQVNLEASVLTNICHSQISVPILASDSASIEVRCLDGSADPARIGAASVLGRLDVDGDGVTAHVLAKKKQRPPDSLLDEPVFGSHEGRDDVDGLCDVSHAHILGLADESVQKNGNSKGVGKCVLLLGAL